MRLRVTAEVIVVAAFLGVAASLLALLPAEGFFSSDEGVKFIQLESWARNGWRDARVAWPGDALGLDRRFAVAARFFELSAGELYSPHSLLFALASAPAWWALGFRGLYILPLLAGAAAVLLTLELARRFGVRRRWLAGAVVAFGSPLFFYSLCFWEHTAAVALWLGGFALIVRRSGRRLAAAGALWGLGAALRPEFYWLAAWAVAAAVIFAGRRRLITAAVLAAAFAGVAAGWEFLAAAAWGQPAFMRLAANLGYSGAARAGGIWFAVNHSLVPLAPAYLSVAAASVGVLAILGIKWRGPSYAAVGAAAVLTLLYWRFFDGYATPWAASFPAAFGLLFLSRRRARRLFRGIGAAEKAFYLAAGGFAATLFVVVPDTSGFAWGPRFLLYVIPAAAVAVSRLAGGWPEGREGGRRAGRGLVALLITLSAATQIFGLVRLRAVRGDHAALTAAVRRLGPAPIIVNKWYLPLYAAPAFFERPFVTVTAEEELARVAAALAARRFRRAYFLTELPPRRREAELYQLNMTSLLTRYFVVTDGRPFGGATPGGHALGRYMWTLAGAAGGREVTSPGAASF